MDYQLYINYCGIGIPSSENWHLTQAIELQRLYYILDGSGEYTLSDGTHRSFQKGYVYLFPYNLRDAFVSDPNAPVQHLFFDFLSMPPILSPEPIVFPAANNPELTQALSLTCDIFRSRPKKTLPDAPVSYCMLKLILTLLEESIPLENLMDPVICLSLDTMQKHYQTGITVRQLAEQAGFEENYYIRKFRSVMGQTPYAYLRSFRLMQARRFLRNGLTMAEAAGNVGYESAASLARALRRDGNEWV